MENAESLAQGAVERLSEDESLRGNLTDDGFSPVLNWAANAAIAYAQNLKVENPPEAMDKYASQLKSLIQALVEAAQQGKIEDPAPLLDFITPDRNKVKDQLSSLKLSQDPDENAQKIVEVLSQALTSKDASQANPAPAVENTEPSPAPATSGQVSGKTTTARGRVVGACRLPNFCFFN